MFARVFMLFVRVTQKYMLTQVLKLRGLRSHNSVWGVVVFSPGRDSAFSNVAC